MITATTSRIWIKPPMVVLVTRPSSQRIIRITQIVHSIYFLSRVEPDAGWGLMLQPAAIQLFKSP
jgi:hypothetical protein